MCYNQDCSRHMLLTLKDERTVKELADKIVIMLCRGKCGPYLKVMVNS